MNFALEIKKRKAEILRVQAAKADQEVRIDECLAQIEVLKASMDRQDEHVVKLQKEIADLEIREKGSK